MVDICNAIEVPASDDKVLCVSEKSAGVSAMCMIITTCERGFKDVLRALRIISECRLELGVVHGWMMVRREEVERLITDMKASGCILKLNRAVCSLGPYSQESRLGQKYTVSARE
jgi:hypothetical protein